MTDLFRKLAAYFARRRTTLAGASTPMLALLLLAASAETGFFGIVLNKLAPAFVDLTDKAPPADLTSVPFLMCLVILTTLGVITLWWKVLALRTGSVLGNRLFA